MIGAASGVILLGLVQDILDLANVSNYWIEAIDGELSCSRSSWRASSAVSRLPRER